MRTVAAAILCLSALVACGSGGSSPQQSSEPPGAQSSASATPTTSSPVPTPSPAASSSATALRGRYPVIITAVSPRERTVTVDVVQLFLGDAASSAAAEDGAAEVPPPNDVWIRNVNPRLRTLSVAPGAPVTVNVHGAAQSGSSTKNVPRTLEQLARIPHLEDGVFWVTVRGGVVVRIAEQYLP